MERGRGGSSVIGARVGWLFGGVQWSNPQALIYDIPSPLTVVDGEERVARSEHRFPAPLLHEEGCRKPV